MERRASIRRPIRLKALLQVGELPPQTCIISDFCAEGLFVQYGKTVTAALAGQVAEVDAGVQFSDSARGVEYRLPVRIARTIPGAMGLAFLEPNPAALSFLLQFHGNEIPSEHTASEEPLALLLRQCVRTLQQHVKPLLEQFLQELIPALQQAAEAAPNDAAKTAYLDAASLVRVHSGRLLANCLQELTAPLNAAERPAASSPSAGADVAVPALNELSLIEKSEFEDWLTLKVMITKTETQYRAELLLLKMRLDRIGVVSRLGYQNPLGPALVCYAFRDALQPLRLPSLAEKLCYRQFEKLVMRQLEALYQELNRILTGHGVLPDLDLSKYLSQKPATSGGEARVGAEPASTSPQPAAQQTVSQPRQETAGEAPAAQSRAQGTVPVGAAGASVSRDTAKRALADTNTQLQSQLQFARSAFGTVCNLFGQLEQLKRVNRKQPAATAWSYDEFQRCLAQLQAQQRVKPPGLAAPPLRRQLEANLQKVSGQRKELTRDQREPLDVIDQFFVSLTKNPRLSEAAKVQVKRLELPVLKLLLRDHRLFDKKNSPLLTIINRIAELNSVGSRLSPLHQERIDRLIHRVCEEYDKDAGVAEEVVAELDDMVERQHLLFRRNVERVTAAAEGSQKVEDSKRVVNAEIARRIAGQQVPKAIISLINGGWRDLLSLTFIRQGADSPAWHNYLNVLDILLAVGRNPAYEYNLADLLDVIKEGLASISSNHLPSGHLREELKRFLTRAADAPLELVAIPSETETDAHADVRMLSELRRRGQQRWLARVQKLRAGEWFRMERPGEPAQQIRLVWIGKGFSRFVFVNHQGMKVIDLDADKLASHLQRGLLVPEPDQNVPIVDQSLDAMVKEVYDQLSYVTTHDDVTRLINRKEFERELAAALLGAEAEQRHALLYLDLRQFKLINDTAGDDAGNQVLADVARLLSRDAPSTALIGRMGGNEFAVLVRDERADAVAQRYLQAIHEYRLEWRGRRYELALAIGVAQARGALSDAEQFLKSAEQTCRRAKKEGPNRIRLLDPQQGALQQEQLVAHIAGLGSELKGDRILLRCQKVIPLHAETRVGTHHQVLLSVYDDRGQLIPAYEFVRMAERYNRMQAVDRWVVGHVLDWMAQNRAQLEHMGSMSISLSGHSLNDEELLEFIFERLSQKDAPIDRICFEVTEAAAIANVHGVAEFMQELQEYGCRFCLGNFGSGMASYQSLKSLPVDLIKIDGSFIKNLDKDPQDQMMVRSMAEMVHFMNKELIATQVENKACLDLLSSLKVDYAQGYCIEKPRLLTGY